MFECEVCGRIWDTIEQADRCAMLHTDEDDYEPRIQKIIRPTTKKMRKYEDE